MTTIRSPFGKALTLGCTATGNQNIIIASQVTVIDADVVKSSGHRTLNLTIDPAVQAGAILKVKIKYGGAHNFIFGTNITHPTLTGIADNNTAEVDFIYDGTSFNRFDVYSEPVITVVAAAGDTIAATPNSDLHIINGTTNAATEAKTLNITLGNRLVAWKSKLLVTHKGAGGARTLTFGTNITAPQCAGTQDKTFVQEFIFNGTGYIATGAIVQLD